MRREVLPAQLRAPYCDLAEFAKVLAGVCLVLAVGGGLGAGVAAAICAMVPDETETVVDCSGLDLVAPAEAACDAAREVQHDGAGLTFAPGTPGGSVITNSGGNLEVYGDLVLHGHLIVTTE